MKKIMLLFFMVCMTIQCKSQDKDVVKKIDISVLKEKIKSKDIQLIDVRTPEEFKEGAIANAKLMNFFADDFKENMLKLDKEKPVYLYCRSGKRSSKASKILVGLGFKEVYDVKGGYKAWKENKI